MSSIKVLSIDWDYFIDCSINFKQSYFPDGGNENLPEQILDQIWMTRYSQCSKLKDIKVDMPEVIKLRRLLKKAINPYTKVVIADSHKDIYKHIDDLRSTGIPVELYNIDFHHDVYDLQSDEVDCGNWLRLFMNDDNSHDRDTFTWVRRKDSELSDNEIIDDNSIIGIPADLTNNFQLVFICRSGVWSPPHLDKDFLSLCRYVTKLSKKTEVIDQKVNRNRYNRQFKTNVDSYTNFLEIMRMGLTIPNNTKQD